MVIVVAAPVRELEIQWSCDHKSLAFLQTIVLVEPLSMRAMLGKVDSIGWLA